MNQYPAPQAYAPAPAGMAAAPAVPARQPKRNVALILGGLLLLLIAVGVGSVFALNLYQYLTVADRWAADPALSPVACEFGVRIVERAAMKRMMVLGPVMGFFGLVGLVLTGLGLRKK